MDYPTQCSAKLNRLKRSLSRTIGPDKSPDFIPSPEPFGYRTHIGIACEKRAGEILIGFTDPDTRSAIDISGCLLVPDWANERYRTLREVLKKSARDLPDFFRLRLFFDFPSREMYPVAPRGPEKAHRWLPEKLKGILKGFPSPRSIEREISGVRIRLHPASFVQANYYLTERLYEEGLKAADPSKDDIALELYAGSGFYTLAIASKVRQAHAVEADMRAIENLVKSAKKAGLDSKIRTLRGRVEDMTPEMIAAIKPSLVIANPPRSGLHPGVIDVVLGTNSIRKIALISCDPATLVRDITRLMSGGFSPGAPVVLDCYPQTAQAEIVIGLSKVE
jgi:23S rRNA (uracil1939-C5)-methyltransferase